MMALCEGLTRIDVFDLDDGCRLLFSLQSSLTFSDMAFSADGAYAVGVTASGTYVIGDLFADEAALILQGVAFGFRQLRVFLRRFRGADRNPVPVLQPRPRFLLVLVPAVVPPVTERNLADNVHCLRSFFFLLISGV